MQQLESRSRTYSHSGAYSDADSDADSGADGYKHQHGQRRVRPHDERLFSQSGYSRGRLERQIHQR
jgi:hypothetical protein